MAKPKWGSVAPFRVKNYSAQGTFFLGCFLVLMICC